MQSIHARFLSSLDERSNGQASALMAAAVSPGLTDAATAGLDADAISASVAESLGLEYHSVLDEQQAHADFVARVPISFARQHAVMALRGADAKVFLAMSDLRDWPLLRTLRKVLGVHLSPLLARRDEILRVVNTAYENQTGQAQQAIEQVNGQDLMQELQHVANEDLLDVDSRAPVIKLVNLMLFEAVKRRASDVHIQPYEDRLVVRLRIDGVLYDVFSPPKALQEEILSRVKIMGQMNIAERRLPQDGRATVEVGQRVIDLRIATLPTTFGERAVIRLLDKSNRLYRLDDLGMPEPVRDGYKKLINQDHGIVLVSGPTGSGKSTTLYAALQEINSQEMNILTLEDPIEYRLEGISQTQISEKKGMTFATGLRNVLRQDPDVIMVGEIRDGETAHMAIQSALTGHLVFSTLHTNDAAGAVARMLDLGVEPYLLASSLLGVLAQRLVRRVCPLCRRPYEPSQAELEHWGLAKERRAMSFFRGAGCDECMNTGFRGRLGIFELLTIDENIRELILQRAKASSIASVGLESGMITLREDGVRKTCSGETTMDEILRVAGLHEF